MDDGKITKDEYKRMARPALLSSIIGVIIGIIPGTGASMASWFSYDVAKNMSRHKEEFGHGSVEGIAAAESANNAVTGATLIPLLTLGIPGDGCVAIMLSALMINHARTALRQPVHAFTGQISDKAFCQSRIDPAGDPDSDHRDLLLCRRLLCQ